MDEDFWLIQKMRMGDERAVDAFVQKYYPRILKYCRVHIADEGYAQDLAQETFVRFFGAFREYRHCGKAVNFLYVIAANICRDFYRRNREIPVEQIPEQRNLDGEHLDERLDVRLAFSRLPDEIREVAILYFLQEQKQKDIARILDIGLPLVKYRIRRARELLTAYFGKEQI